MTYSKTVRKMNTDSVTSRDNIQCSLSTFFRYKPFYITPPSERKRVKMAKRPSTFTGDKHVSQ